MRNREERAQDILATALALPMTASVVLPVGQFFTPTKTFEDWAASVEEHVVDCGAGSGHLDGVFKSMTLVDIRDRVGQSGKVMLIDSQHFPFYGGMAALIARPCGGHWIHNTFDRALEGGAKVYYVGLKKNYDRDFLGYDCDLLMSNVGEDGEELWQILQRSES